MQINGLGAVITGGASGLGAAVASHLAKAGAKVTLLDLSEELGFGLATTLGGLFVPTDVTSEADVTAALDSAEAFSGVQRILVNCAGIVRPEKAFDREGHPMPLKNFTKVIDVNLNGTFNVLSKFAARLHAAEALGEERGVIINTASVAAFDGQIGQPGYAASKAAVAGMTLPLAREFARYGIRVMSIAPGLFLTPMMASLPEENQASLAAQVPFPSRLGAPEEFARLVEAIVTNPMLNGESIRLDGAIRMAPK